MNEQQFENNRPTPAVSHYARLTIRDEVFRFDFGTAATLPADDRFLVDCGTLGRLDSRCLYRPQADRAWLRMSDRAVVELPDEVITDEKLRALPDEGLTDALYCAKWGIVDICPNERCSVYREGDEIDL